MAAACPNLCKALSASNIKLTLPSSLLRASSIFIIKTSIRIFSFAKSQFAPTTSYLLKMGKPSWKQLKILTSRPIFLPTTPNSNVKKSKNSLLYAGNITFKKPSSTSVTAMAKTPSYAAPILKLAPPDALDITRLAAIVPDIPQLTTGESL